MELLEKIRGVFSGKRSAALVTLLAAAGLLLLLISSVLPDKKPEKEAETPAACEITAESYCADTEKRLAEFLSQIDGAGSVQVFLTVSSGQRYVYATEGRSVRDQNRTEEEEKYVIIGSGSEKDALLKTVEAPEITGAVVICSGGGSPAVQERIYRAVSAALDIPTGKIYVTKNNE